MSKKKTAGIIFGALLTIFILYNVAVINGDAAKFERWQAADRQAVAQASARCNELYESGFFNGWMDGEPQNDQAQQSDLQRCLERASQEKAYIYDRDAPPEPTLEERERERQKQAECSDKGGQWNKGGCKFD